MRFQLAAGLGASRARPFVQGAAFGAACLFVLVSGAWERRRLLRRRRPFLLPLPPPLVPPAAVQAGTPSLTLHLSSGVVQFLVLQSMAMDGTRSQQPVRYGGQKASRGVASRGSGRLPC